MFKGKNLTIFKKIWIANLKEWVQKRALQPIYSIQNSLQKASTIDKLSESVALSAA